MERKRTASPSGHRIEPGKPGDRRDRSAFTRQKKQAAGPLCPKTAAVSRPRSDFPFATPSVPPAPAAATVSRFPGTTMNLFPAPGMATAGAMCMAAMPPVTAATAAAPMRVAVQKSVFPVRNPRPFFQGNRQFFQQDSKLHPLFPAEILQQLPGFLPPVPADMLGQLHPFFRQKNIRGTPVGFIHPPFGQSLGHQPFDQFAGGRSPDAEQFGQLPLACPVTLPQKRQQPATPPESATTVPLPFAPAMKQIETQTQIPENIHRHRILHCFPPIS